MSQRYPECHLVNFTRWTRILLASALLSWIGEKTFLKFPNGLIQDDAYFYAQIAYNIGTAHTSSFDGIHQTSGYHLLWGWILGLVSWFTSSVTLDKKVHLLAMMTVYFLTCFSLSLSFGQTIWQKLLLMGSTLMGTVLMETILLSLLLMICVEDILGETPLTWKRAMALVLIPLTRIDAAVIPIVFSLCCLRNRHTRAFLVNLALVGLGVSLHLGIMWMLFGRLMSVSAMAKMQTPSYLGNLLQNLKDPRTISFAALAFLTTAGLWQHKRPNRPDLLLVLAAMVLYISIHSVLNNNLRAWYFFPSYVTIAYLAGKMEPSPMRTASVGFFVLLMLLYAGYKTITVIRHHAKGTYTSCETFIEKVRFLVRPEEPIFQVDGSGYVGFFSGRKVVNGDGLVNSYEFLEKKRAGALGSYLKDNGIRYLITNSTITDNLLVSVGGLIVRRDEVEEMAVSESNEEHVEFRLFRFMLGSTIHGVK